MMRVKVGNINWNEIVEFFDSFPREGFDLKYEKAGGDLITEAQCMGSLMGELKSVSLPE